MNRLEEDIRKAEQEFIAEQKAEEIARKTVTTLLNEMLSSLDIEYSFRVGDGTVHLDLRQELQGSVDIPLEKIKAFLSDPENILSSLSPVKAQPTKWIPASYPFGNLHGWPLMRTK